jgi:hypothetical protein
MDNKKNREEEDGKVMVTQAIYMIDSKTVIFYDSSFTKKCKGRCTREQTSFLLFYLLYLSFHELMHGVQDQLFDVTFTKEVLSKVEGHAEVMAWLMMSKELERDAKEFLSNTPFYVKSFLMAQKKFSVDSWELSNKELLALNFRFMEWFK